MSFPMQPGDLSPNDRRDILIEIQEILWKRSDGTWDRDKPWRVETIERVADVLVDFGLAPDPAEEE